jgi:hypothetical protein
MAEDLRPKAEHKLPSQKVVSPKILLDTLPLNTLNNVLSFVYWAKTPASRISYLIFPRQDPLLLQL